MTGPSQAEEETPVQRGVDRPTATCSWLRGTATGGLEECLRGEAVGRVLRDARVPPVWKARCCENKEALAQLGSQTSWSHFINSSDSSLSNTTTKIWICPRQGQALRMFIGSALLSCHPLL